ncbi:MAG: ATP-binding protein [Gemmatimonadaceae bacterium]|jgi:two-component system sensor histidine kinase KdpD
MTRRRALVWGGWLGLYALVTAFFATLPDIPALRVAHGVLAYLLLIVAVSREGDWILAGVMVVASYLAVDWIFVPPRRQFGHATDLDLVILLGFFMTSVVISRLVIRMQRTAMLATARAEEIHRLSTERLQLEMEAARAEVVREAERLKNALLASVTHDLRSPLATLMMLADPTSAVPVDTAMPRMAEEIRRISEFLRAMRHYTVTDRSEGRNTAIEPQVVDDLIGTARRSRELALASHPVTVTIPSEPVLIMARCDLTLTLQILANLLENAARYSPVASPIDVIVTCTRTQVQITVADRGPGLSADEVAVVFEPLRRGTASAQVVPEDVPSLEPSHREGMGMGLAIARTFARVQQGDVTYRDRDGGGGAFTVTLPLAAAPADLRVTA